MTALVTALYIALAPLSAVAFGPPPAAPAGLLPTPLPLPSVPSVLPSPSPSPSPSTSSGTRGGTGSGSGGSHPASSGSAGQSFGTGGIAGAFSNASAAGGPAGAATTAPYKPVSPPPSFLTSPAYLFPAEHGGAVQSAVPPLLIGLLLVSLGLWLMSMRHRREALQAAALERTKTDFLNLASHELRGPLTVLKGYISTAREGHFGQLPDALEKRLPTVQAQLSRMEVLVEQMLETARLDAGSPDIPREVTDLRRILSNAVPADQQEGADNRVDLDVPDLPVPVEVDEKRLEQVLRNLVDNALKYSEAPARVSVRLRADPDTATVAVTDRGFGIAAEDMAKLFSRFGRLVTDQNSHIPGVGLGLYLGRAVARMHGGDLTAESEPGRGSTFTLTLPVHKDRAPMSAAGFGDEGAPLLQRVVRFVARRLPSRARGSVS